MFFSLFPLLPGLKINIWGLEKVLESKMNVGRRGQEGRVHWRRMMNAEEEKWETVGKV